MGCDRSLFLYALIKLFNVVFVGFDKDFFIGVGIGEEGDGLVGVFFEITEADDIALGFEFAQNAVGVPLQIHGADF